MDAHVCVSACAGLLPLSFSQPADPRSYTLHRRSLASTGKKVSERAWFEWQIVIAGIGHGYGMMFVMVAAWMGRRICGRNACGESVRGRKQDGRHDAPTSRNSSVPAAFEMIRDVHAVGQGVRMTTRSLCKGVEAVLLVRRMGGMPCTRWQVGDGSVGRVDKRHSLWCHVQKRVLFYLLFVVLL